MLQILKSLSLDVLKFFTVFGILFYLVDQITANLPRSWDPTGIGMLALIVLFLGFVILSFKVGASYSDKLEVQEPGTLLGIFKRPVRSFKYGLISLVLNFLLVYLVILINDYLFH